MSSSRAKSNRGRFFGRRKPKPIEPELLEGRAIDPAHSLQDWLAWLQVVSWESSRDASLKIQDE
jgi:hypothetical protein